MLFRDPPTVSEVNRYIQPIVEELLQKYNKVTHPDFDRELRLKTGIGWKQVKNYRSHPSPTSLIPSNSKVLAFVLESRTEDRGYRWRRWGIWLATLSILSLIIFSVTLNLSHFQQEYEVNLAETIEKRIRASIESDMSQWAGCKRLGPQSIQCPDGVYLKQE